MWSELESLIRAHADTSPQHKAILDCLLECKKPEDSKSPKKSLGKEEKMEVDSDQEKTWRELEK